MGSSPANRDPALVAVVCNPLLGLPACLGPNGGLKVGDAKRVWVLFRCSSGIRFSTCLDLDVQCLIIFYFFFFFCLF